MIRLRWTLRPVCGVALAALLAGCGCDGASYSLHDSTKTLLVKATLTAHVETSYTTTYQNGGHVSPSASAAWTVAVIGEFTRGVPPQVIDESWHLEDLTGQVSWNGTGPNGPLTCTGELSPQPDLSEGDVSRLLSVDPPNGPVTSEPFTVIGYVPTAKQARSSDTDPAHAQCNTEIAVGFLNNGPQQGSVDATTQTGWQNLIQPKARYFDGTPNPPSYTFSWSGSQPSTPNTSTTLQVSGNWKFS